MQSTLIRRSIGSELQAIFAIARKEWIIFRRYPSWIVAFLVWPVLFPLGYIFTARALGGPDGSALGLWRSLTGTGDFLSYIVVGSTMYMWLNITLWDVGFFLRNEQMRGTLESNWLCPVWRISIMVGGSLSKLVTALFFLAVTIFEFWLIFGIRLWAGNPLLMLLTLALSVASIYGIGLAFGSLVLRFKEANAMVFLVRGIFLIFCGITAPIQVQPAWMQQVAAFLPLTYAIRAIRSVSLSQATFADVRPDLEKLAIFAVVLPLLGWLAFRHTERRSRRTGSLAQY